MSPIPPKYARFRVDFRAMPGTYNEPRKPVPSDLEIAQEAPLDPILDIVKEVGLTEDDIEVYGKYKAKVHLDVREKFKDRPLGKYIDVTAITPTPLGEGKTEAKVLPGREETTASDILSQLLGK